MKLPLLRKGRKEGKKSFLDLSSREQKKIIMKAVKKSNEKQRELMKKHSLVYVATD